MGNSVKAQVLPDQDCIYEPGSGKVIQSESLEDHGADYVNFLNELMTKFSEPPPMTDSVIKEKVYTEIPAGNPDEFKYRIVLDGEKCKAWGFGDGNDILAINRHVVVDRVKRKLSVWEYLNKDAPDKMTSQSFTFFLENPFRIEGYIVNHDPNTGGTEEGVRVSDENAVGIWRDGFINPICTMIVNSKVKCKADQPSLDGSGDLVIVSDRLDEFVSEDALLAAMLPTLKEGFIAVSPDATVVENTVGAVTTMEVAVEADDPVTPGAKFQFKNLMTLDTEKKTCKMEASSKGKTLSTQFINVRWPQVEGYKVMTESGERFTGKYYAREFGQQINSIVKKAEGGGGVLGAIGLGGMFG